MATALANDHFQEATENAGRASAGLVRPVLENRSRIEPPRLPSFENSRNAASSGRRHTQSRAVAGSSIP